MFSDGTKHERKFVCFICIIMEMFQISLYIITASSPNCCSSNKALSTLSALFNFNTLTWNFIPLQVDVVQ